MKDSKAIIFLVALLHTEGVITLEQAMHMIETISQFDAMAENQELTFAELIEAIGEGFIK